MGAGDRQLLRAALAITVALLAVSASNRALAQDRGVLSPELASVDQAFASGDIETLEKLKSEHQANLGPLVDSCKALLSGDLDAVESHARLAADTEDQEIRRRGEWLLDTAVSWRAVLAATREIPCKELRLRVPAEQVAWGDRICIYASSMVRATREHVGLAFLPTAQVTFLSSLDALSRVAGIPAARLEASGTVATTL